MILGETEAQRGWEPPSRQPRALLEFGVSVLTTGAFPHPLGPPKCHGPSMSRPLNVTSPRLQDAQNVGWQPGRILLHGGAERIRTKLWPRPYSPCAKQRTGTWGGVPAPAPSPGLCVGAQHLAVPPRPYRIVPPPPFPARFPLSHCRGNPRHGNAEPSARGRLACALPVPKVPRVPKVPGVPLGVMRVLGLLAQVATGPFWGIWCRIWC